MSYAALTNERRCGGAEQALYVTTQTIERELGDVAWAAYRLGDDAQRELVELAFELAGGSVEDLVARTRAWTAEARDTAALLATTGSLDDAWQQARANFEVYSLVKSVRERLRLDWRDGFDLAAFVDAAYALGPFADLWAIEGLGHDYAAMRFERDQPRSKLMQEGPAATLPAGSLTMMHAGLGLALAEQRLPRLTPCSSDAEIAHVLEEFVDACRAHSRDGYAGAAYESLGLVARTWHPRLVRAIDRLLRDVDPVVRGYFWHGVGRALYFLPAYIVPGILSPWRAADREAPDGLAHRNLYAGLTWATTLVNLRQPAILHQMLVVHGERLWRTAGFVNGLASAVVVRADTTPETPYLLAFAEYEASRATPGDEIWRAVVRPAVLAAIERYQPWLRQHRQLERVFQCCDLDVLTGSAAPDVPPNGVSDPLNGGAR